MPTIRYLSRADVLACALSSRDAVTAIEGAFVEKRLGKARTMGSLVTPAGDGGAFHAKGGIVEGFAALKWFGYFPGNDQRGLRDFIPLIMLNETRSGQPVAIMDGTWISEVRTAAITAVAAERLARPTASRVGFVACGAQARSHFEMLQDRFDLKQVRAWSRRRATAEAFAAWVRSKGCEAIATDEPRDAVSEVDIVVSSVPHVSLKESFLDARWLAPGAFVSMVDLGWSWHRESLASLDFVVTDDFDQGGGASGLNFDGPFAADLPGLSLDTAVRSRKPEDRAALIFSGTGLADVAVARLIYERACRSDIGTNLEP